MKRLTQSTLKYVCLAVWMLLLVAAVFQAWHLNIELTDMPALIESWLNQFGWLEAATLYVILYTIRPLIFFPATLLTLASGLIFGPVYGILFTIVGENLSANVAFLLARWFGRDWVEAHENEFVKTWEAKLQEKGFVTVVVLRFLMLPFDVVNYGCGLTAIKHRDFASGTFFGILPGLIAFVLLGGAAAEGNQYKLITLGTGITVLALGFVIAYWLKQRSVTANG